MPRYARLAFVIFLVVAMLLVSTNTLDTLQSHPSAKLAPKPASTAGSVRSSQPFVASAGPANPVEVPLTTVSPSDPDPLPAVAGTLVLFNNSLQSGNFLADYGHEAAGVAVDTAKNEVFATSGYGPAGPLGTVSVISTVSDEVVSTVQLTGVGDACYPNNPLYDPARGEIFVSNSCNYGGVYVINDTNDSVVADISDGGNSGPLAYDPSLGEIFAVSYLSNSVSVISDLTDTVTAAVSVGENPDGIVYDAGHSEIFAANSNSEDLSVISTSNNTVVATVPLGSSGFRPAGLAYAPTEGEVFVASVDTENVSVVNDSSDTVVAVIPVGGGGGFGPQDVAFDSRTNEVFVSWGSDNLSVINATTNQVVASTHAGGDPNGLAADPRDGLVFVANGGSDNISIVSDTTNAVVGTCELNAQPYVLAYDPESTDLAVGYASINSPNASGASIFSTTRNAIVSSGPAYGGYLAALVYDSGRGQLVAEGTFGQVKMVGGMQKIIEETNISFDNETTDLPVARVSTPLGWGLLYDPISGEIFAPGLLAPNNSSAVLRVLNDSSDQVVATVPLAGDELDGYVPGLALDPAIGAVVVATNSGLVAVNVSTDAVVENLSITSEQLGGVTFDPVNQELYLATEGGSVYVINGTSFAVIGTVSIGGRATAIAYDPAIGDVFVGNNGQGAGTTVDVLNTTTNSLVGALDVGVGPESIVCDPNNGYAYVANEGQGTLSIISPGGTVFGSVAGTVTPATSSVEVDGIQIPVAGGRFDAGLAPGAYYMSATASGYSPALRAFNVTEGSLTSVNVLLAPVAQSFLLTGSVTPRNASVLLDGFEADVGSGGGFAISLPEGAYTLSTSAPGYFPYARALVLNANSSLSITLTKEPPSTSNVSSDGVAATGFGVTVNSVVAQNDTISVNYSSAANGTLLVSFPLASGPNATLAAILASSLYLNGVPYRNFSVSITSSYEVVLEVRGLSGDPVLTWVISPSGPTPRYAVSFAESGIAAKTLAKDGWTVVLNGSRRWSSSTTINFTGIPNGTYGLLVTGPSGYPSGSTTSGVITVSGATTDAVTFAKGKTYTLTFSEKGLAKGQSWCVSLDGAQSCTTKTSQKFVNLTASGAYAYGEYSYAVVSPLGGQNISAAIGKVSVAVDGPLGVNANTKITYTFAYDYAVVFTETGLTSGTWSVTIKGHTETAAWNGSIQFNLTNGTYAYKIGSISGYRSAGVPSRATVNGAAASVKVTFAKRV